jgi:MYXO-CTERM domain-containing protein
MAQGALMRLTTWIPALILVSITAANINKSFATVPFTEDFSFSASNWYDNGPTNPATFVAVGGPGGGSYASATASGFNVADDQPVVVFRGQDELNSSSHAFEGNWLTSGINHFSAFVKHDGPISLPFFVRFATPSNFPGTAAEDGTLVPPNTWTQLSYDIVPSNIDVSLFPEGPPSFFNSTFSNLGHIQIGYSVPAGFGADANSYAFGVDKISISSVPEPASYLVALGGLATGLLWRRRAS